MDILIREFTRCFVRIRNWVSSVTVKEGSPTMSNSWLGLFMQGKSLWITLTPKVLPRTVGRRELQELVPSEASPKGRTLCVPFIWIFKFKTKISNIAIRLICRFKAHQNSIKIANSWNRIISALCTLFNIANQSENAWTPGINGALGLKCSQITYPGQTLARCTWSSVRPLPCLVFLIQNRPECAHGKSHLFAKQ